MDLDKLISEAWMAYEEAKKLLDEGDLRDAAEKAWLAVETMRKAIIVAAKIPYEETRRISIALPIFNSILIALGEKKFLDKYYTFQSTLHGMSFYEGLLNEEAIIMYVRDVEDWLSKAEEVVKRASKVNATKLLELAKKRVRIKSEILSKSKELQALRIQEKAIIEAIRAQLSS